jgi:hypothetical protein
MKLRTYRFLNSPAALYVRALLSEAYDAPWHAFFLVLSFSAWLLLLIAVRGGCFVELMR